MSKMKLTILKFLSCIDPIPRRNKHSWLEVMTSTREPVNTALDFLICQSHLKHVCSGQVLVNVYLYIYLYVYTYLADIEWYGLYGPISSGMKRWTTLGAGIDETPRFLHKKVCLLTTDP